MAGLGFCSRRSVVAAAGLAAAFTVAVGLASTVRGEPVMTEVTALARAYGAGVHAYFSGDAQRAYDDLTQAIEAGTRDPRAWYFRGLAALKLGRLDEAEADFSTAATRETEAGGDWAVSRSLERVQGHDRLALERHRVRARVAGYEQRKQAAERRYSQIESLQSDVLRERRPEGTSPDAAATFGGEPISPTPPSAPAEEGEAPGAPDAVREPSTEDPVAPAEPEPAEPEPAAEPPMEEEMPEPEPEAPPAPTTEPEEPAMAAEAPGTEPAAEAEKPAAEEEAPADPAVPGDAPMEEKAAEGEAPAPADAPGSDVFDK